MNDAHIAAIISAIAGIAGVILGNSFAAIKEWVVKRKRDERDGAYLAILVVSHLDNFANGCLHVALGKIGARPETVNEVVGGGRAFHRGRERLRSQHIAFAKFDLVAPRSALQARGISH